ncbi:MAG: radical SAM protein [Syntrophomonadaceae bacterium]|nr:radical SAM protein [Syntrophomonadaceae bacterium]
MKNYIVPIFIPHMGCPYDCIYCNQKTIAAQQDVPSPAQTIDIIASYLHTMPPADSVEVAFFGGSFTALDLAVQRQYLEAVQPFISGGRVTGIRVSTRPDYIDDQRLELLAAHQVKTVELGVQSLSRRVLKASSRHYTPEDVVRSSNLIKSLRMDLGIQLMIGLPGDSYQQDMETTRQVVQLRPQVVRIYPTLVIAGTALAQIWQQGKYMPLGLAEAVMTCRDMYIQFQHEDIKVIRMGLYPGEELRRAGNILAGPFHPSFGELVEQEIFKEQAQQAITRFRRQAGMLTHLDLYVDHRDVSKLSGPKRWIINRLCGELGLENLKIRTLPDLGRDWIGVSRSRTRRVELILTRKAFLSGFVPRLIAGGILGEEQGAS